MINCPKCSKPNYDTDKYCASCGFKLYKEPAKKLNRVCLAGFLLLMTSVLMAAAFLATIFMFTEALSDMSTFGALIFIFVMFMIPLTFIAGLIVSIIGISISKKRGQSGSKLALGGIIGTAGTLTAGIFTYLIAGTVLMTTLTGVIISRDNKEKDDVNTTSETWQTEETTGYEYGTDYTEPTNDRSNQEDDHQNNTQDDSARLVSFGSGPEHIIIWTMYDESLIYETFIETHPEFAEKYTIDLKIYNLSDEDYMSKLDDGTWKYYDPDPDIYVVNSENAVKYSKGSMSYMAATYKQLGIDVDNKIEEAQIAQYVVDIGTRDGEIVALGYQSSGGMMIYNASIAREVFGTDDPQKIEEIMGSGTGEWTKFFEAAEKLKASGYRILPNSSDLWKPIENSATSPWIADRKFVFDYKREKYMDYAKMLHDNGWADIPDVDDGDWDGYMPRKTFCYFGSIGFVTSELAYAGYAGDWRACTLPCGYFENGKWYFANASTNCSEGVAEILEWITLDTSKTGLQYLAASGELAGKESRTAVASAKVMAMTDGSFELCGGQDLYPVVLRANSMVSGKIQTEYDAWINDSWTTKVNDWYLTGKYSRYKIVDWHKRAVRAQFGTVIDN